MKLLAVTGAAQSPPCGSVVAAARREPAPEPGNYGKSVTRKPHTGSAAFEPSDRAIERESANQLDPLRGWEAEGRMRVASLESVLAAATLILAIVVVLWEIKIFYGM